jgi:hypothetical protein
MTPKQITRYGSNAMMAALAIGTLSLGCASGSGSDDAGGLHAVIGQEGGELVGGPGTAFEGVRVTIPAGALATPTDVAVTVAAQTVALPKTAVRCGPMFALEPSGLALAKPAVVTLPYDHNIIAENFRFEDEVRVWKSKDAGWTQVLQTDNSNNTVTVQVQALSIVSAGVVPPADQDQVHFQFHLNPKFARCVAATPDDEDAQPYVEATVVRGDDNDGLFLRGRNIKPGLKFDMFTIENSALLADGSPNPEFDGNFGMAWYQSDLEANENGKMKATIRTILLDQIFGFDPTVALAPTQTFQVGFWFNNPDDAVPCGFPAGTFTPFNGEHKAGPLAAITTPDASTGLGPLCTKPNTSTTPAHCDP